MRPASCMSVMLLATIALGGATSVHAQQVLSGDPVDPSTSRAYPIMPGVPLATPGPDEDFGTSDDVVNIGIVGDIDLVIRVGSLAAGVITAPAGAPGGPSLTTVVAGGGVSGQGAETPFTVHVSSGAGSTYGSTLTNADMTARPVTTYAFADLDGDGIVGPTNADGTADNPLEQQEAFSYAGRQVGQISAGRVVGSVGVHLAAPASIGGLRISLSAGAYTGTDAGALYSDGTPIYTAWPFFPPLDPNRVLEGLNSPAPDPTLPSELKFDIERNYLPAPNHPTLGGAFAVAVDGSEPTTDQFVSVSGPARSARFFSTVSAATFRATSRAWLRPAPTAAGSGRELVLAVSDVELAADGAASQKQLRLLPIDLLANVADSPPGGIPVTLTAVGPVLILSPDSDADPTTETLTIGSAAGVTVTLDDVSGATGAARIDVTSGVRILDSLLVHISAASVDQDGDAVDDDGNVSAVAGDVPCNGVVVGPCDDNCSLTINGGQDDKNLDGLGDCCDGECVVDPSPAHCAQCEFVGPSVPVDSQDGIARVRWKLRTGNGTKLDKLRLRADLTLAPTSVINPSSEVFDVSLLHGGDVVYEATLDSAMTAVSSRPKYRYDDPTRSIAGVRRITLTRNAQGDFGLVLQASDVELFGGVAGAWQVVVTSGDDTFVGMTTCVTKSAQMSCD